MESPKKAKHECESCNQIFDRVRRLEDHIEKVHTNNRTKCSTCYKKFRLNRGLQSHQKNADPKVCDVCDTIFCHESELERHKRTEHVGGEIRTVVNDTELDEPICPRTGFEEDEGYKEKIEDHWNEIRDHKERKNRYININKELSPDFTYRDLKHVLDEIFAEQTNAFKINIGFGFMLRDVVTSEFRYFYPSTNNLLFDRMPTISKTKDMADLMKRILDLDLCENYYMKRPSSGWIFVGLPNLYIQIIYLNVVLG